MKHDALSPYECAQRLVAFLTDHQPAMNEMIRQAGVLQPLDLKRAFKYVRRQGVVARDPSKVYKNRVAVAYVLTAAALAPPTEPHALRAKCNSVPKPPLASEFDALLSVWNMRAS